jgi:osomolarity two-component system, sensor histidine kinase SLN1
MPASILLLVILFALFVFLCGAGHLLKCLGLTGTTGYVIVNTITAAVSLSTALYLLPLIPYLMSSLDHNIQELVKLNEESECSKRKLMTFMAYLCHEIRNPLFIITSTISFMHDNPDDLEQANAWNLIKSSTDLMLRLVNDVLDISRLQSGNMELEKQDFDLHQTLEDASTSTRAHIRARHGKNMRQDDSGRPVVELRTHVDPNVPKLVHGDQVRILQVCHNLLSNAVKWTEKGHIDFSVSVCDYHESWDRELVSRSTSSAFDFANKGGETDDTGDYSVSLLDDAEAGTLGKSNRLVPDSQLTVLKIRVEDTGCGIPAEQTRQIFQPYSMAKLAQCRQMNGTGLGLAIVSKLTTIMNGTITVRSSVGIGSVFEAYMVVERASLAVSFSAKVEPSTPSTPGHTSNTFSPSCRASQVHNLRQNVDIEPPLSPSSVLTSNSEGTEMSPRQARLRSCRRSPLSKFDFPCGDAVVLVVDDNPMNRKLLSRMLKSFNLENVEACNGKEAVDVMLKSRNHTGAPNDPQIGFVLMDLSMPVMGGCDAIRLIRQNGMDVPIMALTAAAIEEGRDMALAAGATAYATKPILTEDLHSKCTHFLSPSHIAEETVSRTFS